MQRIPSVATLKQLSPDRANELRHALMISTLAKWDAHTAIDTLITHERYPQTRSMINHCHYDPGVRHIILCLCSEILGMFSPEYIGHGRNKRSPAIDYVNSGDLYNLTIMYVHGSGYRVGCVADIIERGNYA